MEKTLDILEVMNIVSKYREVIRDGFYFIQIGANDGKTGDLIHEYVKQYDWKGILVEPMPHLFKKLQVNYRECNGLLFENVAINKVNGQRLFYHLKENNDPGMPRWYDQLGTFDREVLLKHKWAFPEFDRYFSADYVECVTLDRLIRKHGVKKIDLLNIDTEGYDFEIIKLVPFTILKPAMILYEHIHLSHADQRACREFLALNNYKLIVLEHDTFAYQT